MYVSQNAEFSLERTKETLEKLEKEGRVSDSAKSYVRNFNLSATKHLVNSIR